MVVCELGSHRCPHIACVSESVKQHDCRALSANSDMNCRAVGLNLLSTEVGRKYTRGSGDDGDGLFGCIHKGVSFLFGVVVFPGKASVSAPVSALLADTIAFTTQANRRLGDLRNSVF
jgi:hypothetical protein